MDIGICCVDIREKTNAINAIVKHKKDGFPAIVVLLITFSVCMFTGCSGTEKTTLTPSSERTVSQVTEDPTHSGTPDPTNSPASTTAPTPTPTATEPKHLIVIDAGHQSHANLELEPDGPGSGTLKYKVAGGTSGVATGVPEYERTLEIALFLEQKLLERGYDVMMVRTSNDVDISNSERAAIANKAGADAFLRIHCNGSENSDVSGAMTLCQTQDNPYNGELYEKSSALANCVLDALVASAECNLEYVWETDTMAGINWCNVPVTLIEVGYMTNPEEDSLLASPDYQEKIVSGIANGVDNYFNDFS